MSREHEVRNHDKRLVIQQHEMKSRCAKVAPAVEVYRKKTTSLIHFWYVLFQQLSMKSY